MLRAKKIPLEVLRQQKPEKIILRIQTFFLQENKALITFSILKQCPTFFRGKNLLNL